jgi:molybdopterin-guanine dinucleotide biosynthesis protein A
MLVGLFVGGRGKRMGGVAKGLLRTPGGKETLIERLVRVCRQALPEAELYLVGQAPAYGGLALPFLDDSPTGVGPIGGLCSLLASAQHRGATQALALACDLPFIDSAVLSLLGAPLTLAARVPFVGGRLQPLAATYAPARTLAAAERALASGRYSLLRMLEELGPEVERVAGDDERAQVFRDWDTPEDMAH